jgi:hypothetical protein
MVLVQQGKIEVKMKNEKQNDNAHPKKLWCVISVARQVDGEWVCVKTEKAFKSSTSAEKYANNLARNYAEKITTASGVMNCICERGVFEIDVDEQE